MTVRDREPVSEKVNKLGQTLQLVIDNAFLKMSLCDKCLCSIRRVEGLILTQLHSKTLSQKVKGLRIVSELLVC